MEPIMQLYTAMVENFSEEEIPPLISLLMDDVARKSEQKKQKGRTPLKETIIATSKMVLALSNKRGDHLVAIVTHRMSRVPPAAHTFLDGLQASTTILRDRWHAFCNEQPIVLTNCLSSSHAITICYYTSLMITIGLHAKVQHNHILHACNYGLSTSTLCIWVACDLAQMLLAYHIGRGNDFAKSIALSFWIAMGFASCVVLSLD